MAGGCRREGSSVRSAPKSLKLHPEMRYGADYCRTLGCGQEGVRHVGGLLLLDVQGPANRNIQHGNIRWRTINTCEDRIERSAPRIHPSALHFGIKYQEA